MTDKLLKMAKNRKNFTKLQAESSGNLQIDGLSIPEMLLSVENSGKRIICGQIG